MGGRGVDLPQGTLDLLILGALALEPKYGWAIADRIHQISRQAIDVPQGSLYPALHRLERRGWLRGRWGVADTGRRAKTYELTAKGRRQLEIETDAWKQLTAAVSLVIENA